MMFSFHILTLSSLPRIRLRLYVFEGETITFKTKGQKRDWNRIEEIKKRKKENGIEQDRKQNEVEEKRIELNSI